ncbi:MAG TPA: serine/threonine-protein kinase [Kofleriaceae bacterium]|jgi:tetratricopeptide (TPR) repeat protein/predicted Ser/Thr protein kinase
MRAECPAADVLSAFAAGELTASEAIALEGHLDSCQTCLGVVGCLAQSGMHAAGVVTERQPGSMVGRYQILATIGRGAFGVVYAAYDPELDRKIALKLLLRNRQTDDERFQHEARAMARVSNPHVVAVHDVGRFESCLFTAMEFVDGQTLGEWSSTPRTVRAITSAFAQAGRGLAAAHAAGIVHRDFKPDNVLVHRDGRVAVTDFGLARYDAVDGERSDDASAVVLPPFSVQGTLIGTPLYMAPEALRRDTVDVRSDVFSFCVVLYRALFAAAPFAATTVAELLAAIERGPKPLRDTKVPRHLRDVVLAGLHPDPAQRPSTMHTLIAALEHDPRRAKVLATGASGLVVALGVVWAAIPRTAPVPRESCREQASALVDDVWGVPDRAKLRAAILEVASEDGTFERVTRALDLYAASWAGTWTETCEAELAHVPPAPLIARRFACLEKHRARWRTLVSTLEHPDAIAVAGASTAAYALPGAEACANDQVGETLAAADDPRIGAAYASIARAQVLADLGNATAGLALVAAPLELARTTADRALESEALIVEGDLRRAVDPRSAEEPLHEAAIAASAAGRLDLEARAKVLIVETLAHAQLRLADAHRAADYAEAAVMRLGDPALSADYLYARALVVWSEGGAERSLPLDVATLLVNIRIHGATHPCVAEAQNNLASTFLELDNLRLAVPLLREALAMREHLQGPQHPEALNARGNLAFALAELGEVDQALALQETVAADRARELGPDYFLLSETWVRLSHLYQDELGRPDDAIRAARRAREIDEKAFGSDAAEGIASLANLARILAAQGLSAEADRASERALEIADAHLPADHLLVRGALAARGDVLQQILRCDAALAILDRLDAAAATKSSGRGDLVIGLHARARCERANGHAAAAETALLRALSIREQSRGTTNPMLAGTLLELSALYRGEGRWTDALAVAKRALDVREHTAGDIQERARRELADVTARRR